MKKGHTPLVVGNWKMNPRSRTAAKKLVADIKKGVARLQHVTVVIAPPTLFIPEVFAVQNGSRAFMLSAQNVHWEGLGAHTGEVATLMLNDYHVAYCIVGHSERRAMGETDDMVNKKVQAILKAGMRPVLCIGEKKRDLGGSHFSFVEKQVRAASAGIPKTKMSQVIFAYEPIWAIGTGNTATPEDAYEMKLFIQKILTDMYGRNIASKVCILYGGSVNPKNAAALLEEGNVDGFLVGGASLQSSSFIEIAKTADQYEK